MRPEVFAWHVTTGTLTRDEARAMVFDLAPLPGGEVEDHRHQQRRRGRPGAVTRAWSPP